MKPAFPFASLVATGATVALVLAGATTAVAAPSRGKGPEPFRVGRVVDRTSLAHHHPYSLYVPSRYTPQVSWPLVVSSHGRGGSGKGEIKSWVGLANRYGFIVACPDMITATVGRQPTSNLPPSVEDEQVIMSIVKEVEDHFRVNRRAIMLTGFSGGGNPSYFTGLRHPDVFSLICSRSGNFAPQEVPTDSNVLAEGRKRQRILIVYGDHDHPLILGSGGREGQARMAYEALKKAGYEHLSIRQIKGMKHQSRPGNAAEWFAKYIESHRRLFAAGDRADELVARAEEKIGEKEYREGIRYFEKARKIEEKAGLRPRAKAGETALNKVAMDELDKAKEARADGKDKEAQRLLHKVLWDFEGLPAADEAKTIERAWKK